MGLALGLAAFEQGKCFHYEFLIKYIQVLCNSGENEQFSPLTAYKKDQTKNNFGRSNHKRAVLKGTIIKA